MTFVLHWSSAFSPKHGNYPPAEESRGDGVFCGNSLVITTTPPPSTHTQSNDLKGSHDVIYGCISWATHAKCTSVGACNGRPGSAVLLRDIPQLNGPKSWDGQTSTAASLARTIRSERTFELLSLLLQREWSVQELSTLQTNSICLPTVEALVRPTTHRKEEEFNWQFR